MTTIDSPTGRIAGRVIHDPIGDQSIHQFLGVHYAEEPVGRLRLRPPVRRAPRSGVLDATAPAPRSIQPGSMLAPAGEPEGEDCLALNVWTPDSTASLPVMVWFHGGSFTSGSGSLAWYDGVRLAGRGVVVVTVNYRLGALGFLDLAAVGGDEWAGCVNVGLQDQTMALDWVQDHIGAFGGDPRRVTIFGESAGAMSVCAHLAAPGSAGRFRRAIAQSGAAGHVQTAESGERVARHVLSALGVAPDRLGDLAEVDIEAFRAVVGVVEVDDTNRDLPLPFRPTVDGVVLPTAPLEALAAGAAADIDLLTGTNRDEMQLFRFMALMAGAPADLDRARLERRVHHALAARSLTAPAADVVDRYRAHHPGVSDAALWSAISTDLTFRIPMLQMLDAHGAGGGRSWSYHLTHESTSFDGGLGAAHAVEIPFVFDNLDQAGTEFMLGEVTQRRREFAAAVADRWVAFATADDLDEPGCGWTVPGSTTPWPRYVAPQRAQVVLDLDSHVLEAHHDDLRRLWLGGD